MASASKIKSVSSAYWIVGNSSPGQGIGLLNKPREVGLFIIAWSRSAAKTNNNRERGSPYRTLLLQQFFFLGTPFSSTADVPEEKISLIQWIQVSGKPICCITDNIVLCSTVSKAFSKSSFRITISLLEWWHWWMNSKHQAKQSCIVLDLIKSYWYLWMSWRMTCCSLSARILVNSFRLELSNEIGLKSLTDSGLLCFGTKVMKELLTLSKFTFPPKKLSHSL